MIQPTSKLPWKQILYRNKYQIRSVENYKLVIDNVEQSLADAMYIEEACNNYPKAIELLKKCFEEAKFLAEGSNYPSVKYVNEHFTPIEEFLKQIENE